MATGSIFENNRTQAVRLPRETRFPEGIKKVTVRIVGKDRVLSPVESTWDSFFAEEQSVTGDFMKERSTQHQDEREGF